MVGSSSTTRTVPWFSAAIEAILASGAALPEGEGIALHPRFGLQPQDVVADARQVDEFVEALRVDGDGAGVDIGTGGGADRLAVEEDLDLTRLAVDRAEDEIDVTGAEVEFERTAGGSRRVEFDAPRPPVGPVVRRHPRRRGEVAQARRELRVGEAFGAGVAEVGLRRRHPGGWFDAFGARHPLADAVAGFGQQLPDHLLFLFVFALAEVDVADVAASVDEVLGRPVLVAVGVPGFLFVVLGDGIADAVAFDRFFDVAGLA